MQPSRLHPLLLAAAGGLVLGGGVLATTRPWPALGAGASLTPLALSRLVLSGQFGDLVPRAVGVVPLLPMTIVGLWLVSSACRRLRVVGYAVCLALSLATAYGLHLLLGAHGRPALGGVGVLVQVVGCAVGLVPARVLGRLSPSPGRGADGLARPR